MPDSPKRPKEVSCLGLTSFFEFLDHHNRSHEELLADLPYPPEYFTHRLNWIDYQTFLILEQRMLEQFDDEEDLFFTIGTYIGKVPSFGFLRVILRSVTSPFQIYKLLPRLVKTFLFPFVSIELKRTGDASLQARYTFDDRFPPTVHFIDTIRGILSALPHLVATPTAQVQYTKESDFVHIFDIFLEPEWLGPTYAIQKMFRRLRKFFKGGWRVFGEVFKELEETNSLLQEKVDALTEAKSQLDRKVRELSILHDLNTETSSELDLSPLLDRSVRFLSQRFKCPVAIFTTQGHPPLFQLSKHLQMQNKSIRRLRRAFANGTELSNLLLAGEFASTQAHQPQSTWVAFPMKNRKKVIGALLLEFSPAHSEEDLALLGAIANELAVAMDNAISYQLITELRDTLELRVNERTQELELARTRLEQTVQRLEESDQAKRDFFTNVSHELKTPLTLISAPLDNIEDALPEDNHNAKEHVLLIRENTQTLLALLNEILDFAKLDTNDLELVNVEFDISRMLDDLCTALKPLADRKQLSFQVYLPQEPIFAYGDRKMLRRVTTNLLVNAIKYVEEGDAIKVRLSRVDTDIVLEVADTGPGIPEKEQDKIFERFHRAQDTHGRTIEGSGIGLAMAREIIELHGGHISIQSTVNKGATFTVRLPQEEAILTPTSIPILQSHEDNEDWLDDIQPTPIFGSSTSHETFSTQQTKVNGSRILLVEDNPKMRRFLTTVLSAHYQIYTAHDGREGLELAKKQRPELILSDVMMPHMNGYELCRAIKHDPHMRLTPIILISAKYGTEAALEAFEANADDFVIKPFSPSELIARINAQLKIRSLTLSLLRMEKQSTLGFMAAGLAHEIYNPINAIINATPPLRSLIVKPQPEGASPTIEAELLEAIELSGQKIRKVIDAVLAMARQDDTELYLEKTSISKEFESILAILGFRIHSGYQIHQEYEWNEPFYCYPKLLSQVLMNLLSNALDALDPEGGDIWLRVRRKDDRVVLQMENNGPPIPLGDREKIFMPFYTTKDPDKGTGLGLAICREVTEIHKGTLQLIPDSEHTTFSLELPYISQPT